MYGYAPFMDIDPIAELLLFTTNAQGIVPMQALYNDTIFLQTSPDVPLYETMKEEACFQCYQQSRVHKNEQYAHLESYSDYMKIIKEKFGLEIIHKNEIYYAYHNTEKASHIDCYPKTFKATMHIELNTVLYCGYNKFYYTTVYLAKKFGKYIHVQNLPGKNYTLSNILVILYEITPFAIFSRSYDRFMSVQGTLHQFQTQVECLVRWRTAHYQDILGLLHNIEYTVDRFVHIYDSCLYFTVTVTKECSSDWSYNYRELSEYSLAHTKSFCSIRPLPAQVGYADMYFQATYLVMQTKGKSALEVKLSPNCTEIKTYFNVSNFLGLNTKSSFQVTNNSKLTTWSFGSSFAIPSLQPAKYFTHLQIRFSNLLETDKTDTLCHLNITYFANVIREIPLYKTTKFPKIAYYYKENLKYWTADSVKYTTNIPTGAAHYFSDVLHTHLNYYNITNICIRDVPNSTLFTFFSDEELRLVATALAQIAKKAGGAILIYTGFHTNMSWVSKL